MTRPDLDQDRVGLCARCRHARTVDSRTSVFWLCERSKTDPRFPRYPRLPVLACPGFDEGPSPEAPHAEPRSPSDG